MKFKSFVYKKNTILVIRPPTIIFNNYFNDLQIVKLKKLFLKIRCLNNLLTSCNFLIYAWQRSGVNVASKSVIA